MKKLNVFLAKAISHPFCTRASIYLSIMALLKLSSPFWTALRGSSEPSLRSSNDQLSSSIFFRFVWELPNNSVFLNKEVTGTSQPGLVTVYELNLGMIFYMRRCRSKLIAVNLVIVNWLCCVFCKITVQGADLPRHPM